MAAKNEDLSINFKIITGENNETMTIDEFESFLDDQKETLDLQEGNYLAYVVDNMYAEGNEANKAILLKLNDGETQVFYNSADTYIKSMSKRDHVSDSDYGIMSPKDYTTLYNLDQNLNTEEAVSILNNVNDVVNDIVEVDEDKTVTNTNKIYKFKDGKISTIDDILSKLDEINENLTDIQAFLSGNDNMFSEYTDLASYIQETIQSQIGNIINSYINHTHYTQNNN